VLWSLQTSGFGELCEDRRVADSELTGCFGNEPFGSRSEPDIQGTRIFHLRLSGEIPKGRAGAHLQPIGSCA
jgi:hypothetical protein